ncbi:MAG: hypothetical protein HYZ93_01395 [Candidatus Omnitrophica bacterium]|nr:hypothetical protein [Candidatus Omnitrophota bacterium]
MGRLMLVGLLAFAVALMGTAAYAEVQNIKVGGDIDMKAAMHNNYDLKLKQKNEPGTTGGTTPVVTNDDNANFYLSTVHVTVDADLTDNVAAHVRLVNQRFWDADGANTNNVNIDNAYVVLKEFLYSPLTVMVGRQNLKYGTGFIVGDGLLGDPNGIFTSIGTGASTLTGIGREYSAYNAFDAIRLILDYSPVTIEGLIAKVNETGVTDDDEDLYGVYVSYKTPDFAWWKDGVIEPYWFFKNNESAALTASDSSLIAFTRRLFEVNRVHTFGVRTAGNPMQNLWVNAEIAAQAGEIKDTTGAGSAPAVSNIFERKRHGWAANLEARYNWAHVRWTPTTGGGYVYFSGTGTTGEGSTTSNSVAVFDRTKSFGAWDAMYRGSFTTFIQDFLAGNDAGGLYTTFDGQDTSASTNRHLLYGDFSVKPLEDLTLWLRYTHAWFAHPPRVGRSHDAGYELDAKAVYNYTDDVQLALFGGWFFPGRYYYQPVSSLRGKDLAWTTGGSATVKF